MKTAIPAVRTRPTDRSRLRGRRRRPLAGTLLPLGLAVLTLSCGDSDGTNTGPPEPDPGPLRVIVVQAPSDAGGVLLELQGDVVGPVTALGSHRLWEASPAPGRRTVLVAGGVGEGALLSFQAADRNEPYSVLVLDGAAGGGGDYARHDAGDYALRVER